MKRWFLIAFTILIILNIAYAQEEAAEEKILGLSVSSLLVVLPIAMVGIGLIFFVGLYLKDHYADVAKFFKGQLKRRRTAERKKKAIDYPKEVRELQRRLPSLEAEESTQHLSNLAKKFFAEKFNIDYEFTHGELEKELEKEKASWASFPRKLSDLRYSGEPLSKKEVAMLVKEFWDIVKYEKRKKLSLPLVERLRKRRLTLEIDLLKNLKRYLQKAKPRGEEKLTSMDVIRYFLKRQKQNLSNLANIFKKVEKDATAEIKIQLDAVGKVKGYFSKKLTEKKIGETLDLIEEAQKQITKGKIDEAKKAYQHAYHMYYKLPIEEQVPIIIELQKIQKNINQYKRVSKEKATIIDPIKEYFEKRLTQQRINKVKDLIKEAQKQITKGKTEQAKKACHQAYKLYYHLPIEEQLPVVTELQNIQKKIKQYKPPKPKEKLIEGIKRTEQKLTKEGVTQVEGFLSEAQKRITTELQNIQKKIGKYKKIPGTTTETAVDQIKEYFEKRLTGQKVNKVKDLIEEAHERIAKGKIDEAKKAYKHAHRLYYYLPIEEQAAALFELRKIEEHISESEKSIERLEIEELAKELNKLKSESDIYVIFDKSDIQKKLNFITKYAQRIEKQGLHGLKAGKIHLKEKLNDLIETAEKEEKKKLTQKEKSFISKLKDAGLFYSKKEEALEKAMKQTQKQIFAKLHNLTKQIRIGLHPKTQQKIVKPQRIIKPALPPKPGLKPSMPPLPKEHIREKEPKILTKIENLLSYLEKRREEGFYKLRPKGKEFLEKIESLIHTIKENEQKGITTLKHYEKEFINSIALFAGKKEEKVMHPTEEEKRMLEFLEHMKEEEMIHVEEEKLRREKERLKAKPLIETPKVKMNIARLKKLAEEEEKIMHEIQKIPEKYHPPPAQRRLRRKRLEKYNWEITADEIKRKKTKEMHDLLEEEEKLLLKLNQLEKDFNS